MNLDKKTIWRFREELIVGRIMDQLRKAFYGEMKHLGVQTSRGKIFDASIVESTSKPRKKSRDGEPAKTVVEANPHRERQNDSDARSTMKRERWYFGYKNHIKVDAKTKLIVADVGEATTRIMHKGKWNKPVTSEQKAENTQRAKTRNRVEHVFGDHHTGMRLTKIRTRRETGAEFMIRLKNLAYNLRRQGFLLEQPGFAAG